MADLTQLKFSSSTPSLEKPAGSTPPLSKEAVFSTWDKRFQPILKQTGFAKALSYDDNRSLVKAINGKYDAAISNKDLDENAREELRKYKNQAWDFMKIFENSRFSGGVNTEQLNAKHYQLQSQWAKVQEMMDPNKDGAYTLDEGDNIVDRKTFDRNNTRSVVFNKARTNITIDNDEARIGNNGYNTVKNFDRDFQSKVRNKTQTITQSWLTSTIGRLSNDNESSGRVDADNRLNAYKLSTAALQHIAKYGSLTGESGDKTLATKILNEMRGMGSNWNGKINVIKRYQDDIKGLHDRLGYWGTSKIYNMFKDNIGDDEDNYSDVGNVTGKAIMNQRANVDFFVNQYASFKEKSQKLRGAAFDVAKRYTDKEMFPGYRNSISQLLNGEGDIVDFDTWKNKMRQVTNPYGGQRMETGYGGMMTAPMTNNHLKSLIENNKSNPLFDYFTVKGDLESVDFWGNHDYNAIAKHLYNETVKSYKKAFNDIKVKNIAGFEHTLMMDGIGNKRIPVIGYKGVDLSVDDDGHLKKFTGNKQEGVSKILSSFKDDRGLVDNENIAFFNTADINAIQKRDILSVQENAKLNNPKAHTGHYASNQNLYDNFFQNKNRKDVVMEFNRETQVKGFASYTFIDTKTGEELTAFVAHKKLKDVGEPLYKNTFTQAKDWEFELQGYQKLPGAKNKYQNVVLKTDKNQNKIITLEYMNEAGKWTPDTFVLGNTDAVSVDQAISMFNNFTRNTFE